MQNFKDLYIELAEKIDNIQEVEWIDLWHNQISFLETEHPFPTPAVFLGFRANQIDDVGNKVQKVQLQVDVYLFYESFLDTYKDAWNQDDALGFLDTLDQINQTLHASQGENYSSMRRVGLDPIDTGGSGNLYRLAYTCELMDYSAIKEYGLGGFKDVEVQPNDYDLPWSKSKPNWFVA